MALGDYSTNLNSPDFPDYDDAAAIARRGGMRMDLDAIDREEFGRMVRAACHAAGRTGNNEWEDLDDDTRGEYRVAGDHLRACLKARLAEAPTPTPRRLNDLVARD